MGEPPILRSLEALPRAKAMPGGRWRACCPAHEDGVRRERNGSPSRIARTARMRNSVLPVLMGEMHRAEAVMAVQRELVQQAMEGDFEAFSGLVRAAASRQYAIATLILRDSDRAQDAVQEALVAAWRGLSALRDPVAWDAWINRLTVRACYAAARHDRRRTLVELHVVPDREPQMTDGSGDRAERDRLERLLARLPIDQRAVIVLHFYVGLPLTEAADILDIPHGTAKSRLARGLTALRSTVSEEPDGHGILLGERPA